VVGPAEGFDLVFRRSPVASALGELAPEADDALRDGELEDKDQVAEAVEACHR
jgi:hypothetical protein